MAGFDEAIARKAFEIPDIYILGSVIALGYQGEPAALPNQQFIDQEVAPRKRKTLERFRLFRLGLRPRTWAELGCIKAGSRCRRRKPLPPAPVRVGPGRVGLEDSSWPPPRCGRTGGLACAPVSAPHGSNPLPVPPA